jgi:hypothetical protein
MRRLLTLAGLAAAGAAAYRRLRGGSGTPSDMTPAPTSPPSGPTPPADTQSGRADIGAPAPADAPGPSVSTPDPPQDVTDAEVVEPRSELAVEKTKDPTEALVADEEAKAAAEAGAIGGPGPHDAEDPAMEAVYEGGGGEAEGFELSERDLVDNATHGGGRGKPLRDAFTVESEQSGASYGEADEEDVSEVTRDADAEPGDASAEAGEGPGRASDV